MNTLVQLIERDNREQARQQLAALVNRHFALGGSFPPYSILAVVPFRKPVNGDVEFLTANGPLLDAQTNAGGDDSLVWPLSACMTVLQITTLPNPQRPVQISRFYAIEDTKPNTAAKLIGEYKPERYTDHEDSYRPAIRSRAARTWASYDLHSTRDHNVKYLVQDYFNMKLYRKALASGLAYEDDVYVHSWLGTHSARAFTLHIDERKITPPRGVTRPVWRDGQWHRMRGSDLVPVP